MNQLLVLWDIVDINVPLSHASTWYIIMYGAAVTEGN